MRAHCIFSYSCVTLPRMMAWWSLHCHYPLCHIGVISFVTHSYIVQFFICKFKLHLSNIQRYFKCGHVNWKPFFASMTGIPCKILLLSILDSWVCTVQRGGPSLHCIICTCDLNRCIAISLCHLSKTCCFMSWVKLQPSILWQEAGYWGRAVALTVVQPCALKTEPWLLAPS